MHTSIPQSSLLRPPPSSTRISARPDGRVHTFSSEDGGLHRGRRLQRTYLAPHKANNCTITDSPASRTFRSLFPCYTAFCPSSCHFYTLKLPHTPSAHATHTLVAPPRLLSSPSVIFYSLTLFLPTPLFLFSEDVERALARARLLPFSFVASFLAPICVISTRPLPAPAVVVVLPLLPRALSPSPVCSCRHPCA